MTIDEIDREIERLKSEKEQKEIEILSNKNEYVGKFYMASNCVIGKITGVEGKGKTQMLVGKELFFDNECNGGYEIVYDCYNRFFVEQVEIITELEFVNILNSWIEKIKVCYYLS